MVRLVYCEMLGYEASFGYIHAIKLAQQGNLFEKRVGMYLKPLNMNVLLKKDNPVACVNSPCSLVWKNKD